MDTELLKKLMALFEGFAGAHGTHGIPEKDPERSKWNIKRTARTLRQPVTEELWQQHVEGKRPLGVIPIREDSSCSWGSIDFDVYDVDLLKIVKRVEETNLPLVPCISKSGGLHLFLFLKKPEPAAVVQTALRDAAASLGMAESEIFPKQQVILADRGDLGQWMVMPYFGSTYEGKLRSQRGLKKSGAEMTLAEFVKFAENNKATMSEFLKLCDKRRDGEKKEEKTKRKTNGAFSDGPPCLQHLVSGGVQKEGRKRMLFMMALYYKRQSPTHWREDLEKANQKFFTPALGSDEVSGIIKSVTKKDYEYTCKEEPMRSHCNSSLCRMRKFGVGQGGLFPVITGMSKLQTDPPVWFVDVDEARLELTTDELQMYIRFHKACMEKMNKSFKMMRQDAWLTMLGEAMANVNQIEAPVEISVDGKLMALLQEFLTNRARGTRREDLRMNRPFEEDGRHYFKQEAFEKFIAREGSRDLRNMQSGKIYQRIVEMGGGRDHFTFQDHTSVRVVWVPADKVQPGALVEAESIPKGDEKDI